MRSLPWLEIAAAAFCALACAALFRFTAEDAFIVQRYALQFVRGHGLVFNVGERVSALTSPLQALVLTAFTLVLPAPMIAYKVVGAAAVIVTLLCAGRELFADVWERALFFSATLGSPFVAMWSVGGLETPLLLACVTVIVVLTLRSRAESRSAAELFVFFFVAALAFLVRHDSAVFVAPLAAAALAKNWRRSVPGLIAASMTAGAWVVFAWFYYGDALPTSFYRKAVDLRPPLLSGIGYQGSFAILCLLPIVAVRRPGARALPAGAYVSVVLFSLLAAAVGTVHMMFGYRFYVPVLPALVAFYMRLTEPITWIARRGFVLPLAVNLALLVVVHSHTVNPTIFHPALFEPHYGFLSRLERRGFAYEYTKEGAWVYGDFIDSLQRTGLAIREDAQARGIERSARLATIIAGATTNEIPDVYVYDNLVGTRRNCRTLPLAEINRAADYLELMVPRFGPIDSQLGPLKSTATPVSDIAFTFDGRTERLVIYFNPSATHTSVPSKLRDPCPPGRK